MPRKPVDYSKTVIYKLVCNDLEVKDIYVGSTSNFRTRKNKHKSDCNNEKSKAYKLKVYQTIRATGGFDKYSMIEIEKYPCKDKNEALARERYWLEELKAKLNTYSPTLNVEKKEYMKKYNATHREELKEYHKKYNATEERKEKKRKYDATEEKKEKSRKYHAENREERNRKALERYYKKKAEKILISSV